MNKGSIKVIRVFLIISLLSLSLSLTGCGGGAGSGSAAQLSFGGSESNGGGGIPTPVPGILTEQQRADAMGKVLTKMQELKVQTGDIDLQKLADYILTLPEFEIAELSEEGECLATMFIDGVGLTVVNHKFSATTSASEAAISEIPSSQSKARNLTGQDNPENASIREGNAFTGIPQGHIIRLWSVLGVGLKSPAKSIKTYFDEVDKGADKPYEVIISADATIDNFKNIYNGTNAQDDAVFYIDTHGANCYYAEIGSSTRIKDFCLLTASKGTHQPGNELIPAPTTDPAIIEDIRNKYVGFMIASTNQTHDPASAGFGSFELRYFINSRFVDHYMTFGKNSMVFMNTCYSDHTRAQNFKNMCFKKNASLYFGWSWPVDDNIANAAARYLFDRLLGSNIYEPEVPKQRPFDWNSVKDDMHNRKLDCSPYSTEPVFSSYLGFYGDISKGDFGLFRPSIQNLMSSDFGTQPIITIYGIFGSEKGEVTLAGAPLDIIAWNPTNIVCNLPASGGGDVVVKARGHMSNAVPLTCWSMPSITFTYNGDINYLFQSPPSLYDKMHDVRTQSFSGQTSGRLDIHGYRKAPHGDLYYDCEAGSIKSVSSITGFSESGFIENNYTTPNPWDGTTGWTLMFDLTANTAWLPTIPGVSAFFELDPTGTGNLHVNGSVPDGDEQDDVHDSYKAHYSNFGIGTESNGSHPIKVTLNKTTYNFAIDPGTLAQSWSISTSTETGGCSFTATIPSITMDSSTVPGPDTSH
ncbi:MAG: IPT/TIG domain-containing protein [Syntrophales bacterium]|nr:IPT/TIG domain-containing protein [Syntrophales bacterium]